MEFIHSILESIGFNWHVALANFINFLIILFVLNKFVFGKVVNMVKERDATIKKGLDNASHAEETLRNAKRDADENIRNAKNEAEHILREAVDRGAETVNKIVSESEMAADKLQSDLKNKIANAKDEVTREFAGYAPTLVADLLKKTLSKTLTKEDHDNIVMELAKK
jgi:F-type H+-transporting ATPase subunit b